jgi:adenosylcobinamide-GDP ribazoletransferase
MLKTDAQVSVWQGFVAALSLLSRLPLPDLPAAAFKTAPRHVWAFPLVGALLGTLTLLAGTVALWLDLPPAACAGVMLGVSMLLTGAMHEDGLADTCDGFWGGFDRARRLEIMKDSQIGSYGVLALVLVTGLRWVALTMLVETGLWPLIAVAALSRGVLPLLMATTRPARNSGLSHDVGRPALGPALWAFGLAALVGLLFSGWAMFGLATLALAALWLIRRLAMRKIGGQTGDVLGAAQQVSETVMLLFLVAG